MNNLKKCFAQVLQYLITMQSNAESFETLLTGDTPGEHAIKKFIAALQGESITWNKENPIDAFLHAANCSIEKELNNASHAITSNLITLAQFLTSNALKKDTPLSEYDIQKRLWSVFSHEAQSLKISDIVNTSEKENAALTTIKMLREKRKVRVSTNYTKPLCNIANELVFTSNILLTLPKEEDIEKLPLSEKNKEKIRKICTNEKQRYWYDHPIPFGVSREADELIYGLRGLSDALKFEKDRGTVEDNAVLTVILSVSVTHTSLSSIAREYLQSHIAKECFEGIAVYVFTEEDACYIAQNLEAVTDINNGITQVFGVDGRYGRHYSFLKAITAVWNVCVDNAVRATFKIDLDQIFPQDNLVKETGKSAFEHLATKLWGANGVDSNGESVHLGMIAGALVNEADIHKGLFTPDVNFPKDEKLSAEELFFPRLPLMAISTRAEMMTRYGANADVDGEHECIQRVHVTGGTNGILVDALRSYRPFTPSFIGRAEDQAYLLSVHAIKEKPRLSYVHAAGLLMRHDKAAFASEAIHAAKHGSFVGDLLRSLLFSYYAESLPEKLEYAKEHFAPFTSCFISDIPICFIMGRLVLSLANLVSQNKTQDAQIQLDIASRELIKELEADSATRIATQYQHERSAWNAFYDTLDIIENETQHAPQRENIRKHISACRIL